MASGITIKGLDKVLSRINKLEGALRQEVNNEINAGVVRMNAEAIRNIKTNNSVGFSGGLWHSQVIVREDDNTFSVVNTAPYAAFVEFGTGRRADPPAEWADLAATFKGRSIPGAGGTMFDRIKLWVRAKGISGRYSVKTRRRVGNRSTQDAEDSAVAWLIMRSIIINGIHPHPFLYPAFVKVSPEIVRNIERVINRAINK
jgi:hypothetical protein